MIFMFLENIRILTSLFISVISDVTNELMILTVSDSGVLFVYECTTLRWSAKLPIAPITLCRANIAVRITNKQPSTELLTLLHDSLNLMLEILFQLKGTLILLSEQGDLSCCYLGTKPSLFVAPPLENSITSYKNVAHKLEKLQDQIKAFTSDNGDYRMNIRTVFLVS